MEQKLSKLLRSSKTFLRRPVFFLSISAVFSSPFLPLSLSLCVRLYLFHLSLPDFHSPVPVHSCSIFLPVSLSARARAGVGKIRARFNIHAWIFF